MPRFLPKKEYAEIRHDPAMVKDWVREKRALLRTVPWSVPVDVARFMIEADQESAAEDREAAETVSSCPPPESPEIFVWGASHKDLLLSNSGMIAFRERMLSLGLHLSPSEVGMLAMTGTLSRMKVLSERARKISEDVDAGIGIDERKIDRPEYLAAARMSESVREAIENASEERLKYASEEAEKERRRLESVAEFERRVDEIGSYEALIMKVAPFISSRDKHSRTWTSVIDLPFPGVTEGLLRAVCQAASEVLGTSVHVSFGHPNVIIMRRDGSLKEFHDRLSDLAKRMGGAFKGRVGGEPQIRLSRPEMVASFRQSLEDIDAVISRNSISPVSLSEQGGDPVLMYDALLVWKILDAAKPFSMIVETGLRQIKQGIEKVLDAGGKIMVRPARRVGMSDGSVFEIPVEEVFVTFPSTPSGEVRDIIMSWGRSI